MPIAFITVDKLIKDSDDFIKFTDKSQQYWNCNVQKLFQFMSPGNRIKIDYNVSDPKDPNKKPSKYINQARLATSEDEPNTFPDKEPYDPTRSSNRGGSQMSKDYDPEVGKRQTAANNAGLICAELIKGVPDADKLDAFAINFPVIADMILDWVNGHPKSGSDGGSVEDGQKEIEF